MDGSTTVFSALHYVSVFAQVHVHWVGDAIQPSHPLSSPSPPACSPSQHHSLYHWVSSLHQVAKHWSFKFSINPSNEYSRLIFFRMDWLDLLSVQGTLKSLLQHHSSRAPILLALRFLHIPTLTSIHDYGKTIALTRWTFVGKVMSLLFNMLSRLVITSSKQQVSFNFMAAVTICSDFGAQKNKVSHCFPINLPWT